MSFEGYNGDFSHWRATPLKEHIEIVGSILVVFFLLIGLPLLIQWSLE